MPSVLRLVGYTLPAFTGFCVTSASLPVWLVAQGIGPDVAGLVTTVLLLATVGTQMLVPRLAARLGMAPVLCTGLIALGAPTPLLLLSSDLRWVLLISAVRGIGFGFVTVLGSTVTARIVPAARRGEAIGIYGLAIALPNLLAVPGGVALVSAGQFAWVAIIGAAPLAGLPVAAALARDAADEPVGARATPSGRARSAALATLRPALVLLVVTFAGGALMTFLPIALPAGPEATVALLLFGITGTIARWRAGVLADRVGTRSLLPAGSAVAAVGLFAIAWGLAAAGGTGTAAVLAGAAVMGAGYGAVQNLTLLAGFARAEPRHTATVSAVWNAGFDAGTALGAAVVGPVAGILGMPAAFAVTAGAVVASIPAAATPGRGRRRE